MFQVIEDLEQADKLWEAGLLWFRYDNYEWELDPSYTYNSPEYAPSKDKERCPSATYQYAILLEE